MGFQVYFPKEQSQPLVDVAKMEPKVWYKIVSHPCREYLGCWVMKTDSYSQILGLSPNSPNTVLRWNHDLRSGWLLERIPKGTSITIEITD